MSEQPEQKDTKWIDSCDGAYWHISYEPNKKNKTIDAILNADFYKINETNDVQPSDTGGYKYSILLYRDADDIEYSEAIIGDPKGYVDRLSKLGYNGLLVKKNCVTKTTLHNMIGKVLEMMLNKSEIDNFLVQV
jgi:hypothetical protein